MRILIIEDFIELSYIMKNELEKYGYSVDISNNEVVKISCAIGDKEVDGRPYEEIVNIAKDYIESIGGFEKFAEWGLF